MKQAEDYKTLDILHDLNDKQLKEYRDTLKSIEQKITAGLNGLETLHDEKTRIEELGYTFGTIHYKAGKYAYLIQPQKDGQRARKYIGQDPEKIAQAEQRIKRAERHAQIVQQIEQVNARFRDLKWTLENADRKAQSI